MAGPPRRTTGRRVLAPPAVARTVEAILVRGRMAAADSWERPQQKLHTRDETIVPAVSARGGRSSVRRHAQRVGLDRGAARLGSRPQHRAGRVAPAVSFQYR